MGAETKYNHNHGEHGRFSSGPSTGGQPVDLDRDKREGFDQLKPRERQRLLDEYRESRGAKSVKSKALATVSPVDSENPNGEFDVILSTKARDRDGDELLPDEWQLPLPDYITFDTDHGMSVPTTVGGGEPFINDQGQLQVRGVYSSLPHAQDTRTLVNEGIIRHVSVSYLERKSGAGKPVRELLNGSFVPIPANTEAVVLSSKAARDHDPKFPYGRDAHYADPGFRDGVHRYPLRDREEVDAAWDYFHHAKDRDKYTKPQQAHIEREIEGAAKEFGITLDKAEEERDAREDKSAGDVETKAVDGASDADAEQAGVEAVLRNALTSLKTAVQLHNGQSVPDAAGADDGTYPHLQMIHDASVQLGGKCASMAPPEAEDGQVWGANSPTISAPTTSAKSAVAPASPADEAADAAAAPDQTAEALAKAKRLAVTLSAID
ncbi:hypothetical protein E2F47_23570 [Mycobacterium eburneum]|nr:DUF6582 domain-containing protein [Mycobacterium eburneum]TDH48499.1 hypothetical protein E2F47_23570 [Mycobacterium eburneum]